MQNRKDNLNKGFIASIALVLLVSGTTAYSLMTLGSALLYMDSVNRHESRIQAKLNAKACLDTIRLMFAKDYFLAGPIFLPEFGCTAVVTNNSISSVSVDISSEFNGVSSRLEKVNITWI